MCVCVCVCVCVNAIFSILVFAQACDVLHKHFTFYNFDKSLTLRC